MQRREVFYRGRVQGVGFRWTVHNIAQRFAVTGFVKNLEDGRVHLVAEGSAAELEAFLEAILGRMGSNIREATVVHSTPQGEFTSFEIVH